MSGNFNFSASNKKMGILRTDAVTMLKFLISCIVVRPLWLSLPSWIWCNVSSRGRIQVPLECSDARPHYRNSLRMMMIRRHWGHRKNAPYLNSMQPITIPWIDLFALLQYLQSDENWILYVWYLPWRGRKYFLPSANIDHTVVNQLSALNNCTSMIV